METTPLPAIDIPEEVLADAESLIAAAMAGRPPDPEVARRCRERGERITEEIKRKHGILDIVVPAIRELRDS